MKKRWLLRGTIALAAVVALIFVIYQTVTVSSRSVRTEYVLRASHFDTLSVDGYFVRREQVLKSEQQGVFSYTVADGDHVAAGGTVAEIYADDTGASTQARLREIRAQIDALQELQSGTGKYAADPDLLGAQVGERLTRLLSLTDQGRLDGLDTAVADLLAVMNRRQIATGGSIDFAATLGRLQSEQQALQSQAVPAADHIRVQESGYFVSTVDGREDLLSVDELEDLTPDRLEEVMQAEPADTAGSIGKLVTDYEWYIACIVTDEQAENLTVGQTLNMVMQVGSQWVRPVRVQSVNRGTGDGRCVAVLRCDQTSSELFSARQEPIQLRLKEYAGLRVASSAVRVVDGVRGVYVMNGIAAKFKPVNILYANASESVCEYDTTKSTALKLYDEVIVEGKDLYDGKVVK